MIDLSAIRARWAQVTSPPWSVTIDDNTHATVLDANGMWVAGCGPSPNDATAIAHAPEDIAALLAEVEELERKWATAVAFGVVIETERDAYRAMLCDLLASAHPHPHPHPHPTEHPTMSEIWARARELLKNGPRKESADE